MRQGAREAFLSVSGLYEISKMASTGKVVVICNRCPIFSFVPVDRRDFLCMKCKLLVVLEEKILGLQGQIEMLMRY